MQNSVMEEPRRYPELTLNGMVDGSLSQEQVG